MEQHSFEIAERLFSATVPDAECAFVAGEVMRGEGKPHSDIHLVVISKGKQKSTRLRALR